MACNDISNFGFEGGLEPWYLAAGTVAIVQTGELAYAGEKYLEITTTKSTPSGTSTQGLYWLDTTKPYTLTVQFNIAVPVSSVNSCTVRAYLGEDPNAEGAEIASIQPTERNTTINLAAICSFGGPGAGSQGVVLFDEVVFGTEC
ncbi:hypothetical protein BDW74DRAFT_177994 [Aspergillus multicolor]|uniref:uncharacterized protein n=1 Tax=Aspergillus multicolor TaxID=41759 RepID=UPI003CCCB730